MKRPTGPCHFGIGTLFMQVEYPFLRYNLYYYIYVLSFYDRANDDQRYLEAARIPPGMAERGEGKVSKGQVYRFLGWALVIVAITFVFGRVFCNWICPYGTLHQFIGREFSAVLVDVFA